MFHFKSKKHRNKVVGYHKNDDIVDVAAVSSSKSQGFSSVLPNRRSTVGKW